MVVEVGIQFVAVVVERMVVASAYPVLAIAENIALAAAVANADLSYLLILSAYP